MLTLQRIRELLKDRNIQAVAKACGLNPHTIYRLMDEQRDPAFSTVKALSDYLEGKINA